MCLSIPSQVVELHDEDNSVTVDTLGVKRRVSRHLITDELLIGDYVLIHIGFVMNKIDKQDALESIELYREIIEKMDAHE